MCKFFVCDFHIIYHIQVLSMSCSGFVNVLSSSREAGEENGLDVNLCISSLIFRSTEFRCVAMDGETKKPLAARWLEGLIVG